MPTAEIVILETVVVEPHFFIVCFVVAVTSQDREFMVVDGLVVLCGQFHQLFHFGIRTDRRPSVLVVTKGGDVVLCFTVSAVHVFTCVREHGLQGQVFDGVVGDVSVVTQFCFLYVSV